VLFVIDLAVDAYITRKEPHAGIGERIAKAIFGLVPVFVVSGLATGLVMMALAVMSGGVGGGGVPPPTGKT